MLKTKKYQIFAENHPIVFKTTEVMTRNDFERSGSNCDPNSQPSAWLFGNRC